MTKYADAYYAMSSNALWQAYRDGWPGALVALIDRFDGRPPVRLDGLPPAAAWAELLTRTDCPFVAGDRPAVAAPASIEEK